jgi:hypothetical protein
LQICLRAKQIYLKTFTNIDITPSSIDELNLLRGRMRLQDLHLTGENMGRPLQ